MFCTQCGSPLPDSAAFCPACGAKAGAAEAAVPEACTACGSRSLRKIRKGVYLCEYCGSRFFAGGQDAVPGEAEAEADLLALFMLASEHEQKDDIAGELRILLKGLDLLPDNATLLLKLGRAHWRLGQNRQALEYFRQAAQVSPENPVIYINMANIYLTQGQYAEARPLYERSLAIMEADPLSATANDIAVSYGNYGNCLGKMGDRKGAKKYLSIAKKKGYNPESLANVCRQLGLNPRWL